MESASQRTFHTNFGPQEYRPDTHTRAGGIEPGANPICENLGPDSRSLDLSRDFRLGFVLVPEAAAPRTCAEDRGPKPELPDLTYEARADRNFESRETARLRGGSAGARHSNRRDPQLCISAHSRGRRQVLRRERQEKG